MPPTKLRILALHGYAQNAQFFNSRTGAARKGATFVERVLGAVAANKPRGGKPAPDYVAYVKGYLRSGGGAAPKPKPAKKKEPRADEDGCTCT